MKKIDILVGFDSPLLSAEVGCTPRITDETGVQSHTKSTVNSVRERERQRAHKKCKEWIDNDVLRSRWENEVGN